MHHQQFPHRVLNPFGPADAPPPPAAPQPRNEEGRSLSRSNTSGGVRRHKSTRELKSNGSGKLSRSGTLRGTEAPLLDYSDDGPFAKGSLLNNDATTPSYHHPQQPYHPPPVPPMPAMPVEDVQPANTLIQIDDKVKFAKGSLLDQSNHSSMPMVPTANAAAAAAVAASTTSKLSRSKSTHATAADGRATLRRKNTTGRTRHEIPLAAQPAMPPVANGNPMISSTGIPSNGPLLQLDGTREQVHTQELMSRQVKPLLNFAGDRRL